MTTKQLSFLLFLLFLFSSCQKDDTPVLHAPVFENVEVGSGNNHQGVIGKDFHFEMDVVAGDRIKNIQVFIKQRNEESYAKKWSFEVTWDEYQGVKNTNVHKHFSIPADAPEGKYDFVIRVNDENGSFKEETVLLELIGAANLPVNPEVYSILVEKINTGFVYIFNRGYTDPNDKGYKKGDTLRSYVDISNVKGDGILYTILVRKDAGHMPESVNGIDFSKVIVADMREHKNLLEVGNFTNYLESSAQKLMIGEAGKTWSNGDYYLGIVYTNRTYNMSAYYYIPLELTGF